jgi:hypothetical protein
LLSEPIWLWVIGAAAFQNVGVLDGARHRRRVIQLDVEKGIGRRIGRKVNWGRAIEPEPCGGNYYQQQNQNEGGTQQFHSLGILASQRFAGKQRYPANPAAR